MITLTAIVLSLSLLVVIGKKLKLGKTDASKQS